MVDWLHVAAVMVGLTCGLSAWNSKASDASGATILLLMFIGFMCLAAWGITGIINTVLT